MKSLSIVIPVFNTEKYLRKCLDSLKFIDINFFDIIIVNDNSGGDCSEVVNEYKEVLTNIKYIINEKNMGLLYSRCIGILNTHSEYIVNLDPDDWIVNDTYKKSYIRCKNNNLDLLLFNATQVDINGNHWIEDNNVLKQHNSFTGRDILVNIFHNFSRNWIWHVAWNKMIHYKIAKNTAKCLIHYDHLVMYEDLLFSTQLFLNLFKSLNISTTTDIGVNYFRHNDAITKNNNSNIINKKFSDIKYVFEIIRDIFIHHKLFHEFKIYIDKTECVAFSNFNNFKNLNINNNIISHVEFLFNNNKDFVDNFINNKNKFKKISKIFLNSLRNINYKRVAIYGIGELANCIDELFLINKVNVESFILTNPYGTKSFNNKDVLSLEKALKNGIDTIIIASIGSYDEINKHINYVTSKIYVNANIVGLSNEKAVTIKSNSIFKFSSNYIKSNINYISDVSDQTKTIYFGIPKTGCSSIRRSLQYLEVNAEKELLPEIVHDKKSSPLFGLYTHSQSAESLLSSNDYFKFTFIRNPFTRILSAYLDKFVHNKWERNKRLSDLGYNISNKFTFTQFLNYVNDQQRDSLDIHWIPQCYLLPENLKLLNFIGRFENFTKEWALVFRMIRTRSNNIDSNTSSMDVVWHKTNANQLLKCYYTEECIQIVQSVYEEDFRLFNYSKEFIF